METILNEVLFAVVDLAMRAVILLVQLGVME
jgi:hypothetical protein